MKSYFNVFLNFWQIAQPIFITALIIIYYLEIVNLKLSYTKSYLMASGKFVYLLSLFETTQLMANLN